MIRLLRRRIKSPVASSSICTRRSFGIELPVEFLQGLAVRKASLPNPPTRPCFLARRPSSFVGGSKKRSGDGQKALSASQTIHDGTDPATTGRELELRGRRYLQELREKHGRPFGITL